MNNTAYIHAELFENALEGYAVYSSDNRLSCFNPAFCKHLSFSAREIYLGLSLQETLEVFVAKGHSVVSAKLGDIWLNRPTELHVGEYPFADKHWLRFDSRSNTDGSLVIRIEDISASRNIRTDLQTEINLLRSIVDTIPDHLYARDSDLRYTVANKTFARHLGLDSASELIGKHIVVPDLTQEAFDQISEEERSVIETGIPVIGKLIEKKDNETGQTRTLSINRYQLKDENNNVLGILGFSRDETELQLATNRLQFQAERDPLTELFNRRIFEQQLDSALLKFEKSNVNSVICFIDLDKFKVVNDSVGHRAGDELLKEVAQVIHEFVRKTDTIARLGGDEFGIIFENTNLKQITDKLSSIILAIEKHHLRWEDKVFEIGASMGVVELCKNFEDIESVCTAADKACYEAKTRGRGQYYVHKQTEANIELDKTELLQD